MPSLGLRSTLLIASLDGAKPSVVSSPVWTGDYAQHRVGWLGKRNPTHESAGIMCVINSRNSRIEMCGIRDNLKSVWPLVKAKNMWKVRCTRVS